MILWRFSGGQNGQNRRRFWILVPAPVSPASHWRSPTQNYYLAEASRKKAEFLALAKDRLQLRNVIILNERAETLAHQTNYRGQFNVVTARAVAATSVLLELALPFCQKGGYLIAYKGRNYQPEVSAAKQAQTLLGSELVQEIHYELPMGMGDRALLVFQKNKPIPDKYPRRPGIPAKRPL